MQKVIAIDFDGTLCENKYPEIGLPRWGVIFKALSEQENGAALILWTCRTGKELNDAVEACAKWGLTFDAVNKNLPSWVDTWNNDPRKVGATEYWDDRAKSTTDAKDFGKLESKVNGYEIETRPIGSSPCSFETRVTHEDFNNGMPVTVNHYKNLHDAAKGQFNWMKKAEGGFNKLYDIYDNKIYPKEKRFPVSFEENAPVKIALKYRCVYCTTEISHNQRGGIPNEKLPKKVPILWRNDAAGRLPGGCRETPAGNKANTGRGAVSSVHPRLFIRFVRRTEEAAEEQKRWKKISGDRTCHDQIQPNFRPYINE